MAMLKKKSCHLVVVTNEIFSESAKDSEEMRKYKYIMEEINKELAKMADEVTEVVCGRPLRRKVKTAEDKTACGNTRRNEGNERQMKTAKCEMSCGKMKRGIRIVTGGAFQGKKNYAQLCYPGLKMEQRSGL